MSGLGVLQSPPPKKTWAGGTGPRWQLAAPDGVGRPPLALATRVVVNAEAAPKSSSPIGTKASKCQNGKIAALHPGRTSAGRRLLRGKGAPASLSPRKAQSMQWPPQIHVRLCWWAGPGRRDVAHATAADPAPPHFHPPPLTHMQLALGRPLACAGQQGRALHTSTMAGSEAAQPAQAQQGWPFFPFPFWGGAFALV